MPYQTHRQSRRIATRPHTWAAYNEVVEAYNKGGYDGIGYVFDTLRSICRRRFRRLHQRGWQYHPKAKAILDKLNSYSEISLGKGIKVFLKATNPVSIEKKDGKFQQGFESKKPGILEIEVYYGYRFFTLTGDKLRIIPPPLRTATKN